MDEPLDLRVAISGARARLLSPDVGWFTGASVCSRLLSAGEDAGVLIVLGRALRLRVPEGVNGRIVNAPRERMQAPVGYGDVLYELELITPASAGSRKTVSAPTAEATSSLILRSPQSGRFYHRSAPGEKAFVSAGQTIADGQPVGLIEVMKTFQHVVYRAGGGLPARARVLRLVAKDGSDVRQGDVLIELEPESSQQKGA